MHPRGCPAHASIVTPFGYFLTCIGRGRSDLLRPVLTDGERHRDAHRSLKNPVQETLDRVQLKLFHEWRMTCTVPAERGVPGQP